MNKIYKVLFNNFRGSFVVCHEHKRSHVKSSSEKTENLPHVVEDAVVTIALVGGVIFESANVLASEVLGAVDINEPHESSESVLFINNVPHGTFEIPKVSQQNLADQNSSQENQGASTFAPSTSGSESNTATGQTATPLVVALAETPDEPTPEIPQESNTMVSAGDGITVTTETLENSINYKVSVDPAVTQQIKTNSGSIETIKEKVDTNETNIATNKGAIETLRGDVNTNKSDIEANKEAIGTLNGKVDTNETNIATNKGAIETLRGDVNTNKSGIEANKEAIGTLNGKVDTNESNIATNSEAIETLKGNVNTNKSDIEANKEAIGTLNGKVSTNEARIATNADSINKLAERVGTNEGNLTREKQERLATDALLNERTQNIASTTGRTNVAGELAVGDATSIILINGKNAEGASTGTITGLSNKRWDWNNIQDDRAATEGQLKSIAESALTISSENGSHIAKLASEFKFTGGPNLEISVKEDPENNSNGQVFFKVKDNPSFVSVKTGTTLLDTNGITVEGNNKRVRLTSEGLDNGGNKLTNIGRGVNNNDAVTLEQLNEKTNYQFVSGDSHTEVHSQWDEDIRGTVVTISVDHPEMTLYEAGNGLKIEELASDNEGMHKKLSVVVAPGEKNLVVNEEGLSLKTTLEFGQNSLKLDGDNGYIYLKNVTWDPVNDLDLNRAATEGQLYQLSQKGWIADADIRTAESGTIPLGATLSIKGDGGNISTTLYDFEDGKKGLSIKLTSTPTFDSITSNGPIYSNHSVSLAPWTSVVNKDKWQSGEFPGTIADLEGSNIVVTQGQLYDAIKNLNNADRYITQGQVTDETDDHYQITLEQNNHDNVVFNIPKASETIYKEGVTRDIILEPDQYPANTDHLDNWSVTEVKVDPDTGNVISTVKFFNTTLDRSTSGTVKKEDGIVSGDVVNPEDIDSTVVSTENSEFGRDFVISDTSQNRITIGDIASANKLADVSGIVDDHTESIEFLKKGFVLKIDGSERNDAVKAGQTVSLKADENILIDKNVSESDPNLHNLSFAVNPDLSIQTLTVQKKDKDGNPVPDSTKIQLTNSGVMVNGDSYISSGGLNANNRPVTNVKDTDKGNFSLDNKDALNVASFYPTYEKVDRGFDVKGDSGATWNWDAVGKELKIIGGLTTSKNPDVVQNVDGSYISDPRKNISTSVDGDSLSISLSSEPEVDTITVGIKKDKLIKINPKGEGHIEGIQNVEWDLSYEPHYTVEDGVSWAATEIQLKKMQDALITNGTRYIGDDEVTVNPSLMETLSLLGGAEEGNTTDRNIRIESFKDDVNKTQGFQIKLAKNIGLTESGSVSFGEETKLNQESLLFSSDPDSAQREEAQFSLSGVKVLDKQDNNKTALYNLSGLKISNDHTGTPVDLEFSTSRIYANKQLIQGVASAVKATLNDDGSISTGTWDESEGNFNANFAANLGDVKALRTRITSEKIAPDQSNIDDLKYKGGNVQLALSSDEFGQLTYDIKLNNLLKLGPDKDNPSVVIDGSVKRDNPIYVNDGNNGDIRGLSNKTWNATIAEKVKNEQKGRAATEEQLLEVSNTIEAEIGKGLNFQGDLTTESISKKLGETLRIYGGSTENATTDDNILVTQKDKQLHIQLAEKLKLGQDGAITFGGDQYQISKNGLVFGGTSYKENGFVLNIGGDKTIEITNTNISMGGKQIHDVAAGDADTDAVNVSQLKEYTSEHHVRVEGGSNITVSSKTENDVPVYTVDLNNQVILGQKAEGEGTGEAGSLSIIDGTGENKVEIGVKNESGHIKIEGGTKDGKTPYADISVASSEGDGTRLTYESEEGKHTVATTTDGLTFHGDNSSSTDKIALNQTLNVNGDTNITTKADGNGIQITLNKDIDLGEDGSVKIGDVNITNGAVTVGGDVSLTDEGLTVGDVSVTTGGINAGGQKITNVAAGTADTDAVNFGQLKDYASKHQVDVNGGKNTNVVKEITGTGDDPHTFYTVNLNNNVVLGTKGEGDITGEAGSLSITDDKGSNKIDMAVGDDEAGHITIAGNKENIEANLTVTKDENAPTRLSYQSKDKDEDGKDITYQVATTKDGINFGAGDTNGTEKVSLEGGGFIVKGDGNGESAPKEANVVTSLQKAENGDVTVLVSLNKDLHANSVILKDPTGGQYGTLSFIAEPDTHKTDVEGNSVTRLQFDGHHLATVDDGMQYGADNVEKVISLKHNNKLSIVGDKHNIVTESDGKGQIAVKLKDDIEVNSVKVGGNVSINNYGFYIGATGPNQIQITEKKINMGGNQIHGVAPGTAPTDAVNVSQLNQIGGQVLSRINDVDKRAKAGIAQAIATAGLPQAYLPGKNLMAASAGTFDGQTAFAVGISSISDDGKWIVKGTFSGNSQSKFGGSVGVGYQW